jgi:hypothetical protein
MIPRWRRRIDSAMRNLETSVAGIHSTIKTQPPVP